MRFELLDQIVELSADRIVAVKNVSLAEEYLADHFPSFPVLPGVMMIETMTQAARRLVEGRSPASLVLGEVRALRFASMVRPGEALRVEVDLHSANEDGSFTFKGVGVVERRGGDGAGETAVSGRFTLRPLRRA